MTLDISQALRDWPYEPGQITVRRILGDDGREKIQLRLDLGLLQMEAQGRPDGKRPHGHDTMLDYYTHLLARHQAEHGGEGGYQLDEQACELLRAEAVMYYHRYLACFVLEDYDAVERDTTRNLQLMDFCSQYAAEESDRLVLEQYRPYVLMMCARARARRALTENRPKAARQAVRHAIAEVEGVYHRFGQEEQLTSSGELAVLRALEREITARIPLSPVQKLHKELAKAVADERYEDAAEIRDRLERLGNPDPKS